MLTTDDKGKCTTIYVANLPANTDAGRVRELFSDVAPVLHVKMLRDVATGLSRGVAFVMFEDLKTAQIACAAKNRLQVDGHALQVRIAERSALHPSVEAHTRSPVVSLRNVPSTATKEELMAYCTRMFGPVESVLVHPQSPILNGPSPHNAVFITFDNIETACLCVEGIDGKQPFDHTEGHPLITARMISDVAGEMRKSILPKAPTASDDPSFRAAPAPAPTPLAIPAFPLGAPFHQKMPDMIPLLNGTVLQPMLPPLTAAPLLQQGTIFPPQAFACSFPTTTLYPQQQPLSMYAGQPPAPMLQQQVVWVPVGASNPPVMMPPQPFAPSMYALWS